KKLLMNKSILFFFLLLLSTSLSFARIKVVCDVTYENTGGDWSNFYRTEVEFMAGNELDNTLQSNDLYAVIWFYQTNCAIIKMKHEFLLIREVDKTFVYNYFLSDYLNEGKDGQQINDEYNRKWKIFPKNEVSLLIDPIFEVYPYNAY